MIHELTGADFDRVVLKNERLVFVDFWAAWCGPCKSFLPTLEDVADDFADEVEFAKVDIDANAALAERFAVRGVPLLLLFKGGEEIHRVNGAMSRTQLSALLDKHL